MTNKQLTTLCIVAVALLAITVALYNVKLSPTSRFVSGTTLIQGLDPASIHRILVKSGSDTATLVRQGEGFVVVEKDNYPASAKSINSLIFKCLDVRCQEETTKDPANHEKLGVGDESGVGDKSKDALSVAFLDAKGKTLIGLIRGERAGDLGGQYVRRLGDNAVYRAERYFNIDSRPIDYINTSFVAVKSDDVSRVDVRAGQDVYSISRNDKDEITLENIPKGKRAKATDYRDVFDALTNLDMTDVSPAAKLKLNWDGSYTCRLKSGLSYTVHLAKKDDKHYVRLSATGPVGSGVSVGPKDSKEELKKKEAILLAMKAAPEFTQRHAPWVYEISSYNAEKMRRPFKDLIEDILPDEIAARHILIAYKGSEKAGGNITRSKDDARKLAERVLTEAQKTTDADFAKLAGKHSDGPTESKGGDLGTFKKGIMASEFDAAAFKLKVGGTSDVVETKFGFHIIRRTK